MNDGVLYIEPMTRKEVRARLWWLRKCINGVLALGHARIRAGWDQRAVVRAWTQVLFDAGDIAGVAQYATQIHQERNTTCVA